MKSEIDNRQFLHYFLVCFSIVHLAEEFLPYVFESYASDVRICHERFLPCKEKFDDCPIVYQKKTIGSDPFAYGSNGTNGSIQQ